MEKVNYQTQAKIDNIKKDIKDNVSLKDIKKKYFTQSKNKLDKWLSVNSKNFTGEELSYLEYVITGEDVTIVEAFNYLPTTENIALMSIADRQKFLVSNAVIEKLVNLLSSSNTEKDIKIPDEVRELKDIKGQNIRISESIYKEFTDICRRNNVTITSVINTIFYNFNQKHK